MKNLEREVALKMIKEREDLITFCEAKIDDLLESGDDSTAAAYLVAGFEETRKRADYGRLILFELLARSLDYTEGEGG